jgi:hypothetical protein
MSEQDEGGFPQNKSQGQDPNSTTGDGHPPRPGEIGSEEGTAGQGLGQGGSTGRSGGEQSGGSGGSSSGGSGGSGK